MKKAVQDPLYERISSDVNKLTRNERREDGELADFCLKAVKKEKKKIRDIAVRGGSNDVNMIITNKLISHDKSIKIPFQERGKRKHLNEASFYKNTELFKGEEQGLDIRYDAIRLKKKKRGGLSLSLFEIENGKAQSCKYDINDIFRAAVCNGLEGGVKISLYLFVPVDYRCICRKTGDVKTPGREFFYKVVARARCFMKVLNSRLAVVHVIGYQTA